MSWILLAQIHWPGNFYGAYASMTVPVVLQNWVRSGEYANKCTEYANNNQWIALCDTLLELPSDSMSVVYNMF